MYDMAHSWLLLRPKLKGEILSTRFRADRENPSWERDLLVCVRVFNERPQQTQVKDWELEMTGAPAYLSCQYDPAIWERYSDLSAVPTDTRAMDPERLFTQNVNHIGWLCFRIWTSVETERSKWSLAAIDAKGRKHVIQKNFTLPSDS